MKNLRLSYQLYGTLTLALIVLFATNGISIWNLDKKSEDLIQTLYEETYRASDLLLNADRDLYQAILEERKMLEAEPGTAAYEESWRSYQENVAQVEERVSEAHQIFATNRTTYKELRHASSGRLFFDSFEVFNENFEQWSTAVEEMQANASRTLVDDTAFHTARESLNELEEVINEHAGQYISDTKKDNRELLWALNIIVIVSYLLVSTIGRIVFKSILRMVKQTALVTEQVAKGNLQVEPIAVRTRNELGQLAASINRMTDNLRDMIRRIKESSSGLSDASKQISAATEDISNSVNHQAINSQHVMELFSELSHAIQTVAASAENAAELSEQTVSIAGEGTSAVTASRAGMNEVSNKMSRLKNDSEQIGVIIEVIDDIAEQTNLLALNAAIEAARAGEQGRGFAVVADEVRKLAERSTEATKQITSIIQGMQASTTESVNAVVHSVKQTELMEQAFHRITEHVTESSRKVMDIAAASQQQAAQTSEVLQSVESIAAASEETASASGQTATNSQSLAALAEELNRTVASFKL